MIALVGALVATTALDNRVIHTEIYQYAYHDLMQSGWAVVSAEKK